MIDDPTDALRSTRSARAARIDFDRLDALDALDAHDGIDGEDGLDASDGLDGLDERPGARRPGLGGRSATRSSLRPGTGEGRGGAGRLLRLLRPWFDPRPGEVRGAIIVLAGGLVLTTALWFDASRRPDESPSQEFAAITLVGEGDDWGAATEATLAPAPVADVVVHVSGAVASPGLFVLPSGSRVGDAVLAAGGSLPEALLDRVNLARPLEDGEQVHVPRAGEDAPPPGAPSSRGVLADGRIDINRASAEELATLPGIGPARAQAIIAAREERPFVVPGDLRRVSGIGEATFQRLAPLIVVG